MANGNCPIDGPANKFIADPLVTSLFTKEDDYFGLVLVTGWPPHVETMGPAMTSFLKLVRTCFGKEDLTGTSPNVYLYPTECLHVTIATLHHVQRKDRNKGAEYYNGMKQKYADLVKAASQKDDWPKSDGDSFSSMKLQLESVQLGQKAGIFLWNDTTGCINAMRTCIKEEAKLKGIEIHCIPNIIHSTFLRFTKEPVSSGNGDEIQKKFHTTVVPQTKQIFNSMLSHPSAPIWDQSLCKLVVETTPYMHIPNDEEHVILRI